MSARGLLVRMRARSGRESAVEQLFEHAIPMVEAEPDTTAWFALRFGHGEFGIFDAFTDDSARDLHLSGRVAATLREASGELFDGPPRLQMVDVLAEKLPVAPVLDTKGLLLTFKAKPGHETQVEDFLEFAHETVTDEHTTSAWFALRLGNGEYAIFDVFPGSEERFLHLVGRVPRELARQAFKLLGAMPELEMVNVHAEKLGNEARVIRH